MVSWCLASGNAAALVIAILVVVRWGLREIRRAGLGRNADRMARLSSRGFSYRFIATAFRKTPDAD
jgi:hypothetical protein